MEWVVALALFLSVGLVQCRGGSPPSDTISTISTSTTSAIPSETTTTVDSPPQPPAHTNPEDYLTLKRAVSVAAELESELQESAWAGWRDIVTVYTVCPWACAPYPDARFPFTVDEMMDLAIEGATLDEAGTQFLGRLAEVNRRCRQEHPEHDLRFCGRSEVRRDRLAAFRSRLSSHLAVARGLRDALAEEPGRGVAWDSIAGWCRSQQ
jgi:hypothetical protein